MLKTDMFEVHTIVSRHMQKICTKQTSISSHTSKIQRRTQLYREPKAKFWYSSFRIEFLGASCNRISFFLRFSLLVRPYSTTAPLELTNPIWNQAAKREAWKTSYTLNTNILKRKILITSFSTK